MHSYKRICRFSPSLTWAIVITCIWAKTCSSTWTWITTLQVLWKEKLHAIYENDKKKTSMKPALSCCSKNLVSINWKAKCLIDNNCNFAVTLSRSSNNMVTLWFSKVKHERILPNTLIKPDMHSPFFFFFLNKTCYLILLLTYTFYWGKYTSFN